MHYKTKLTYLEFYSKLKNHNRRGNEKYFSVQKKKVRKKRKIAISNKNMLFIIIALKIMLAKLVLFIKLIFT